MTRNWPQETRKYREWNGIDPDKPIPLDLWDEAKPYEIIQDHLAHGLLAVALCHHGWGRSRQVAKGAGKILPVAYLSSGVTAAEHRCWDKVERLVEALSQVPYVIFAFHPEEPELRRFSALEAKMVQRLNANLKADFVYLSPLRGLVSDAQLLYQRAVEWALDIANGEGVR